MDNPADLTASCSNLTGAAVIARLVPNVLPP